MHNKRTYAMLACAVMMWLAMPVFAADAENGPLGGGGTPTVIILPLRTSTLKPIGRRKKQNTKANRRRSLRLTILLKSKRNP